jgi:hypothetical protein
VAVFPGERLADVQAIEEAADDLAHSLRLLES